VPRALLLLVALAASLSGSATRLTHSEEHRWSPVLLRQLLAVPNWPVRFFGNWLKCGPRNLALGRRQRQRLVARTLAAGYRPPTSTLSAHRPGSRIQVALRGERAANLFAHLDVVDTQRGLVARS
jgi:hypothetical protein